MKLCKIHNEPIQISRVRSKKNLDSGLKIYSYDKEVCWKCMYANRKEKEFKVMIRQ